MHRIQIHLAMDSYSTHIDSLYCYCHSLTFSNLLLWASGLPTTVVGHWWRAKWLKLTQWPCLSGPKMNWTGPDENDWTFLKHFLNTCGIESVWPRAAVSWVAFFNLGFQILQRFPDASDCEHEQKFSEWLESCGGVLECIHDATGKVNVANAKSLIVENMLS